MAEGGYQLGDIGWSCEEVELEEFERLQIGKGFEELENEIGIFFVTATNIGPQLKFPVANEYIRNDFIDRFKCREGNLMASFTSLLAWWMLRILFVKSSVYRRWPKMNGKASFRMS